MTVLCAADQDPPAGLDTLAPRIELRYATAATLPDAIEDADGLFLWDFFSPAVREAWGRATRLRWIHVAAAGIDTLLFPELVDSDVVVTNARGVFDRPIAEYVLGAILAVAKDTRRNYRLQDERRWLHRETARVAGSHALVIGTGAIGRAIARLLRAVDVEVRGAGRTARTGDPDFGTVVPTDRLVDHVGWADHVVVVAPLTASTAGMIDADVLAAMRPGSHLVNVGRGPLVDEDALIEALSSGHLGAASLDVFAVEPLPATSPLWELPNVAISAHMSGDVVGWTDQLAEQFVDNATRWLDGRPLANVVDKRKGYVTDSGSDGEAR